MYMLGFLWQAGACEETRARCVRLFQTVGDRLYWLLFCLYQYNCFENSVDFGVLYSISIPVPVLVNVAVPAAEVQNHAGERV